MPRRKKRNGERLYRFKGKRLTAKQIASMTGTKPVSVRNYYCYHRTLEGYENRKERNFNTVTGDGMNIDTLFLQGRIDDYTYTRYLREFERQQLHGRGHKAHARVVNGITYYEMSDKEDYFLLPAYDQTFLEHPIEDEFDAAAAALPIPDYRNMVVRETEGGKFLFYNAYGCFETVEGERWMPSGSMSMPPPDSPFDESLDDYLKRVEEAP